MRSLYLALVIAALLRVELCAEPDLPSQPEFARHVRPLLQEFCLRCHGDKKQEADLRLDLLDPDMVTGADAETWHDILNKLNLGEMPPKEEPQFADRQRETVVDWLTGELQRAAQARRSTGSHVVLRRLTRYEYNHTLRDLLGLDRNFAGELPPESTSADGFQNNGATLRMAPLQMEYYVQAARAAMSKAIVTGPPPEVFEFHAEESAKVRRVKGKVSNRLDGKNKYLARLEKFPREGNVIVRVHAGAVIAEGSDYPRMRVTMGVRSDTQAPEAVLAEADVAASEEDPQTFEFRGRIEDFPLPGHNPKYPGLQISIYNVSAGQPDQKRNSKKDKDASPQSVIVIKAVDFIGPVFQSWPPEHHTRILFERDDDVAEPDYVREVIRRFMERAYRRPVQDEEVAGVQALYDKLRPQVGSLEEAMRDTLAMVLISPDFLYLLEPNAGSTPQRLTEFELASRLSYFLWSSMPDDELFRLAGAGELSRPAILEQQVQRMLADPKSQLFVDQFSSQWLDLFGLDRVAINPEFYPKFDDQLKNDMRAETQAFFGEILFNDLSALNLLDSDFAMLNAPLARHYGIAGPRGTAFERVPLTPSDHRGGLLTQASMLLRNSNGEDSHPIKRAVWLLERILDDPPAPPPPDVPELDPNEPDFAKLSLKQQLEAHREKAACNSCHRRIDPWGIALENFDATGRWRTEVEKKKGGRVPVEVEATLPGGHEVRGIEDLKAYLLQHEKQRFARALSTKMLTYGLGRSLGFDDTQTVDRLAEEFAGSDYRLSRLVTAIVQSKPFQTK